MICTLPKRNAHTSTAGASNTSVWGAEDLQLVVGCAKTGAAVQVAFLVRCAGAYEALERFDVGSGRLAKDAL